MRELGLIVQEMQALNRKLDILIEIQRAAAEQGEADG